MDEKVLREIKIVETEDGFRIEMKGDKEELRKMISDQSRPFFAWGNRFGGRGPFEHLREQHERHHQQHDHDREHGHEHQRGPFGFRGDPRFEGDPRVEALRNAAQKFKRGGYDMGPWWDEESAPSDNASAPDVKL